MIAGIPLRGLRVNYVGELGWELHAPMSRLAPMGRAFFAVALIGLGVERFLFGKSSSRGKNG